MRYVRNVITTTALLPIYTVLNMGAIQAEEYVAWREINGVAQYVGAPWDNVVGSRIQNYPTLEAAKKAAINDSSIDYFHHCSGGKTSFFSGYAWYGSDRSCSAYEKTRLSPAQFECEKLGVSFAQPQRSRLPIVNAAGQKKTIDMTNTFIAIKDDKLMEDISDRSAIVEAGKEKIYKCLKDNFDFIFMVADSTQVGTQYNVGLSWQQLLPEGHPNRKARSGRLAGIMAFPNRTNLAYGATLHEMAHNWGNKLLSGENGIKTWGWQPVRSGSPRRTRLYNPEYSQNTYTQASEIIATGTRAGLSTEERRKGDFGHWGISDANGALGGFDRAKLTQKSDETDGYATYQYEGAFAYNNLGGNSAPFSDIELYLMGMKPESEMSGYTLNVYEIRESKENITTYSIKRGSAAQQFAPPNCVSFTTTDEKTEEVNPNFKVFRTYGDKGSCSWRMSGAEFTAKKHSYNFQDIKSIVQKNGGLPDYAENRALKVLTVVVTNKSESLNVETPNGMVEIKDRPAVDYITAGFIPMQLAWFTTQGSDAFFQDYVGMGRPNPFPADKLYNFHEATRGNGTVGLVDMSNDLCGGNCLE